MQILSIGRLSSTSESPEEQPLTLERDDGEEEFVDFGRNTVGSMPFNNPGEAQMQRWINGRAALMRENTCFEQFFVLGGAIICIICLFLDYTYLSFDHIDLLAAMEFLAPFSAIILYMVHCKLKALIPLDAEIRVRSYWTNWCPFLSLECQCSCA